MRVKRLDSLVNVVAFSILFLTSVVYAQSNKDGDVVRAGTIVRLEYTLFDEQGGVIETNKGAEQVKHIQGEGQIIPGVERALVGMRVGEQKRLKLGPDDAYGPVNLVAFYEINREKVPSELLKLGAKGLGHAGRQVVPGRIHEIRPNTVVVDLNHPLAGKTVIVEVKVVDISPGQNPNASR